MPASSNLLVSTSGRKVWYHLVQIYLSLLIQTTAVLASAVTNGHLLHARNVLQEAKRGTSPLNNTHVLFADKKFSSFSETLLIIEKIYTGCRLHNVYFNVCPQNDPNVQLKFS